MSSSENPVKVQNKVNELNAGEPKGASGEVISQWFPVPGYFAITGFDYNKEKIGNGLPIFNPSFGYPIKIFWNNKTGEIRMFPAPAFEN